MSILQEIFSEQFIYSLGWTLVHSLWQGALIGLIIAVVMIFLHKYTAKLRYFIYSISLFVIAALAVVTFIGSYTTYQSENEINMGMTSAGQHNYVTQPLNANISASEEGLSLESIMEGAAAYCREHFPLFVTIWLLGMLAMTLRFLGGYALVRRYKYHRVKPVMGEWERKFRDLADRIRVHKNVRLFESAMVKVPMAIGYLKPVVLIPLGALNGVPAQQMEAILVHELAHIHRRDYLMNLLQSILEVIFFYHPVVWWLSSNIRIERENICDDIAITITGNKMEFAKALTNIQEMNLGSPALAAGLSGKNKNRLVNRIRRIVGKPKVKSGFAEGFIAASILLISLIGLSAAAMITYPAENHLNVPLNFDESGSTLPGISYFQPPEILPDTTEKEKQKAQYEEYQKQEQMKEMQAVMEAEREAVEAQMEAIKEYEKAMQEVYSNQEQYEVQMQEAMKAYQEAMEEVQINMHGHWTLPQLYHNQKNYHLFSGDSSVWTHNYPGNFYFSCDSLTDIYFDEWTDYFADHEELMVLEEDEFFELQENLIELQELQIAEMEPLNYEFDHDFDHDFDFEYKQFFDISSPAKRIISDELYEDGLIDHGREYIVLIGKKQMLINGEKQTRTVFKKYRRLIDSMEEPWQFDDDDEFRIHIGH